MKISKVKSNLQHIWFQRHLVWEFLLRDLQARYVGSAMGFFWSVINPLILLTVYTFVFGVILKDRSNIREGITDFAFYIFSGILPWCAFQESLIRSTTCIVDNAHLIKQVRFPAKVLPVYLVLSSLVNQLIGTAIFLFVLFFAGRNFMTWPVFPLVLGLEFVFFFGLGLLFSTWNTYLRDMAPLVSIGTMILMWSTPMLYKISNIPEVLLSIIYANPLTYLIMIHHDVVLYGVWPSADCWIKLGLVSFIFLIIGYWNFTRCHQEFADLI